MARKRPVNETGPFMPGLRRYVVNPGGVGRGERQHIEGVAFLLVGVGQRVADVAVLRDSVLNGVGGHPHARVAVGPVDDALATRIGAQPEQPVVEFGHRVGGYAADLVERALDAGQGEVGRARVVPDLGRVGAEHPHLAVVDNGGHNAVGRSVCGSEV